MEAGLLQSDVFLMEITGCHDESITIDFEPPLDRLHSTMRI
jgi:hypothetical protein